MRKNAMRQQLAQMGSGAHALAIQILGNPEDAADAVHDAFAVVLRKPDAYDASKGPFKPWFLRVVRNRSIDLLRKRRPTEPFADDLPSSHVTPEASLEKEQSDRELQQALARLTDEQRQILVLRDYMDLSYAEIALVLDIAAGTVMSRLHRARLALRKELTTHGE